MDVTPASSALVRTRLDDDEPLNRAERRHGSRLAYSVKDTAEALSLGTTKVRQLIKDRRLVAFRVDDRVLVSADEIDRFIAEAEEAGR